MFSPRVIVEGLGNLFGKLFGLGKKTQAPANYVVGYSAPYALRVHEDMMYVHPIHESHKGRHKEGDFFSIAINDGLYDCHGDAKFLEKAARGMKKFAAFRLSSLMTKGMTLQEANLVLAHDLLKASNLITPVLTGNLRASGFVKGDNGIWENLSARVPSGS